MRAVCVMYIINNVSYCGIRCSGGGSSGGGSSGGGDGSGVGLVSFL